MTSEHSKPFSTDPKVVEACLQREKELRKRADTAWALGNKARSDELHREAAEYTRAIGYDFERCDECSRGIGYTVFVRRVDRAAHVHRGIGHSNATPSSPPPASAPR